MRAEASYGIAIEPAGSRVRAGIADVTVADSSDVLVAHETRLPSYCYFPKSDLLADLLERSSFRTFCPFKGTAAHWNVRVGDRTFENAAWSYETPLPEAAALGGRIAFYPAVIDSLRSDGPLPEAPPSPSPFASGPLIDWLLREASLCKSARDLTGQFSRRLLADGNPLWRLNVTIWTLHPEVVGKTYTWLRDSDGVEEADTPHGALQQPAYLNSPVRYVSEGLGGVRQRLDDEAPEFDFPILSELRARGGTDYVAMPLPFSDGRVQILSLASDHPDGFSTAALGRVFEGVSVLSRFYEVQMLRRNTAVLLDTYLGQRTGPLVLGGQTRRGDGEDIHAAILFCDLRSSTVLAETLERPDYLDLLNNFFECAAEPVVANGGEVLKFIGDAVLAIFPVEGGGTGAVASSPLRNSSVKRERAIFRRIQEGHRKQSGGFVEDVSTQSPAEKGRSQVAGVFQRAASTAKACGRARDAAVEIITRIAAAPACNDQLPLRCAIGLHLGEVMYGNVGAPTRLDFTVIGMAANIASRLSTHCRELNESLLLSDEVARHIPDGLRSLGRHRLRDVRNDLEVFTVATIG